jgi:hypothetical protein
MASGALSLPNGCCGIFCFASTLKLLRRVLRRNRSAAGDLRLAHQSAWVREVKQGVNKVPFSVLLISAFVLRKLLAPNHSDLVQAGGVDRHKLVRS